MNTVIVKRKAVKKLKNFHLWVFRDEVRSVPARVSPGDLVLVQSEDGEALGTGFYLPDTRVLIRMISSRPITPDIEFWNHRLRNAINLREGLRQHASALRLVYSEGDYLPGLIVDDYNGHLVVQFRNPGMAIMKQIIVSCLEQLCQPLSIYERSDGDYIKAQNITEQWGQLSGHTPDQVKVEEYGLSFLVDLKKGQKTGYFSDQREARQCFASRIRPGNQVLDAFCYTGAFGLHAASRGAEVTAVDKDPSALSLARENARINNLEQRIRFVEADLFSWLAETAGEGRRFDAICLDPPALIKHKNQQGKGRGLLIDLIHPCLKMLTEGGVIHLSTCAYHLTTQIAWEALRMAAEREGKRLRLLGQTMQGADHPVIIQMPETHYLRGYMVSVMND